VIDLEVLERLLFSAWPLDGESVDFGGGAEAEVDAIIVLREIAGAGKSFRDLLLAPCG